MLMLTADNTFYMSITWLGDLEYSKKSHEYSQLESYVSQNVYSTVTDQEEESFEIKRYGRKPYSHGPVEYLEVDSRLQLSDSMIESIFAYNLVEVKQCFKEYRHYMRRILVKMTGCVTDYVPEYQVTSYMTEGRGDFSVVTCNLKNGKFAKEIGHQSFYIEPMGIYEIKFDALNQSDETFESRCICIDQSQIIYQEVAMKDIDGEYMDSGPSMEV